MTKQVRDELTPQEYIRHMFAETVNGKLTMDSKMYPVMSAVNKVKFFVSEDETTLCFDAGDAFGEHRLKRPIRYYTASDRTDIIHTYLENNLPDFHNKVECLILKMGRFVEDEHFVIDGSRLKKSFPNLTSVYCKDVFEIADALDEICVLDPFEIGELCFDLAQDGDIAMANSFTRALWALDHKWASFFRKVAKDYYRKPEDHMKSAPDSTVHFGTGMDHLFRIYLLGWYHARDDFFDDKYKVLVTKHKNFDKAIDLLPVRFQNCEMQEIAEKLYWDLQHVKNDKNPDYKQFAAVLSAAEQLFPGVSEKMRENGWINDEIKEN